MSKKVCVCSHIILINIFQLSGVYNYYDGHGVALPSTDIVLLLNKTKLTLCYSAGIDFSR